MFKKTLAWLLALMMLVCAMPLSVFASETDLNAIVDGDQTPVTGTISENVVWNDGTVVNGVTLSGDITITVRGIVTVTDTIRLSPDAISSITFKGENDAKLIRGGEFTGQMFYVEGVSGNFQKLTFKDITLDGGAVWTGDVDKTLNRGKTNKGIKATGSVLYLVYANAVLNGSVLQNHDDATGAKANAVFLRYYSTIDFNKSVVRNNNSVADYYRGGVITVRQGGTVKTNEAEIYGNSGVKGGFFGTSSTGSYGGVVEAYNSKFHNNYAVNGAVFDLQCNSKRGYLLIDGCEFYENASNSGLIYEYAYSRPVTIKDSYFHDNECAVWDCPVNPVLDLSGKIVIVEDPDYTKYLFKTPLVLSAPLAAGSSIAMSKASIAKLGGTLVTGTEGGYSVTAADLAKFDLPEGYAFVKNDEGKWVANTITVTDNAVAVFNGVCYETLASAIAAANAAEGDALITLLKNVTLGEKLTIKENITISGKYTITRADNYTGTFFVVNSGAALTLDGGLTIDGGNNYAFDKDAFMADAESRTQISKEDSAKWFTPEEGAPVATAYMITTTGGTVNLNNVTIQNNYSTNSGVVSAGANSTITLTGAKITHIASTANSGVVANVSGANINVTVNDGTVIDGNHTGGNHGMFKVYSGATLTMNGGEIKNTTGWNSNGTVVGIYWGSFYMNGGTICSNIGVYGPSNGRNAPIYGHSGHTFVMTGGTICHNGGSYGGLDAPYDNGKTEITGGSIINNVSYSGNRYPDINATNVLSITGGTYTQDVSKWLAPNCGLTWVEDEGVYKVVTDNLYKLHIIDPATGEPAFVPYLEGNDLNALIGYGKLFYADYYKMRLEIRYNVTIDEAVVIDYPMTIDLNGMTITGTNDIYPVIRVQGGANVTIKNGAIKNEDYIFVLGASDGSSAGNLTIESGTYVGETTVASVTKGTLTINGGNFSLIESNAYDYAYLLNCVDANYKDGSAEIVVNGGTFYKFNPADNAAEGANTNFVADGYFAVNNSNDTWTVKKMDPVVIVNNVPYASWEEAMAANDTYAANKKFDVKNATIVLLADISYDAEFEHSFSGSTVINLNGHKFYAKRGIAMSDTVEIVGPGTFDAGNDSWPLSINGNVYLDPTAKFTGTLQFSSGKKGNLWIGNENALGSTGKYNTADSDAFVRIIFRQGLEVLDFQYGRVTLTEDDTTLDNQKITIGANAIFTVAEGVVLGLNPSTELTLNGKVDGDGTVMVSSFEHLKQVINETEIKNIKLGADVSGIMTIGHNAADQVTIDLNGHTWSSSDVALNVFRAGTEVTLKNGTIKGNSTGGTVHVTYGGKLILGENLTVLSGSRANAISMDTGILEVAADANPQVIGGIGSVVAAGDTTNTINIASGFYDGDFVMNDNTACALTGGTYTLDVDPYCADDYMTKITTKDSNCYWTVVKAVPLFAIHGSNMNLGNSLDMNFFIDPVAVDNTLADEKENKNHTAIVNAMNQKVENWSVVITRIEKGGIAHTKTYTSDAWWYNKGAALMYVIYEDIAARNMTDTIYVQVFDANGTPVTAIWEDSVYNYANRIMKNTFDDAENGDAKAKKRMTLMVDMLNYGAAAQKQFGYRLDALASDIDASYTSYATSNYESLGGEQSIQPENSTLYSDLYVGVSLGLTSDLKMGFAFDESIMDLVNNHNHSITVTHTDYHGKEHKTEYKSGYEFGTIESNDNIALVYYEEILVGDCNQIVTVTVTNDKGEAVLTIKDSVYYYVDRMGERVLPCGIPLLKFSQSARAYLGKAN